jgi:hypothetical protein
MGDTMEDDFVGEDAMDDVDDAAMPAVDDVTAAAIAAGLIEHPAATPAAAPAATVAAAPAAACAAAGPGAREDATATATEGTAAAEGESSSDTSDMSDDDVPAASTAAMLPGTAKPLGRGGRVSACSHASLACAHHPHARCAPFTKSDASRVHILSVCSYALGLNSKPRVHAACVLT